MNTARTYVRTRRLMTFLRWRRDDPVPWPATHVKPGATIRAEAGPGVYFGEAELGGWRSQAFADSGRAIGADAGLGDRIQVRRGEREDKGPVAPGGGHAERRVDEQDGVVGIISVVDPDDPGRIGRARRGERREDGYRRSDQEHRRWPQDAARSRHRHNPLH